MPLSGRLSSLPLFSKDAGTGTQKAGMKEIRMTQIPIHGRGHKNWFIQPLEYHTAVKKDGGRLIQNSPKDTVTRKTWLRSNAFM